MVSLSSLELSTVSDDNLLGGGARLGANALNLLDNIHTLGNLSEDNVLSVQPSGLGGGKEELGSVGVGSSVGHGKHSGSSVLQGEVLVSELLTVDGLATGSVSSGEVTTLAHESGDDTVEGGSLEGKVSSLLASAESAEVLSGLGDNVSAELHNDTSGLGAANSHVKENL